MHHLLTQTSRIRPNSNSIMQNIYLLLYLIVARIYVHSKTQNSDGLNVFLRSVLSYFGIAYVLYLKLFLATTLVSKSILLYLFCYLLYNGIWTAYELEQFRSFIPCGLQFLCSTSFAHVGYLPVMPTLLRNILSNPSQYNLGHYRNRQHSHLQ